MARVDSKARREGLRQEAERVRIERDYIRRVKRLIPAFRRNIMGAIADIDIAPEARVASAFNPLVQSLQAVAETAYRKGYSSTVDSARRYMRSTGRKLEQGFSFQLTEGGLAIYQNMLSIILGNLEPRLAATVATAVSDGYTGELTIPEAKAKLSARLNALGFDIERPYVVETWITTMVQSSYAAGQADAALDPAIDAILWGWEYVTVGDDRVRFEHEGFDGTQLPKNDPFWAVNTPPNGWNCRCSIIEVFDEGQIAEPHSVEVNGVAIAPETDPEFAFNPASMAVKIAA